MGTRDTFRYREMFEGAAGVLPGETAPRLLLIHNFPAGPDGLTSPRAGAGLGLYDLQRFFSDGEADYGLDFAEVYSRQTDGSSTPGAIDVYRVVAPDATKASAPLDDGGSGTPIPVGVFTAVGSGPAYNVDVLLEVVDVIDGSISVGHPANPTGLTPVFNVTVRSPNPDAEPELFRRVVFTYEGGKGDSPYHRTIDASALSARSMVIDFAYDPDANTVDYGTAFADGSITTLTLSGGSAGTALSDSDWEDAIDAVVGLPFRWRAIPVPPNAAVRSMLHISNKAAPFGLAIGSNLYGEDVDAFITARETLGSDADDGKTALVWGWGVHPNSGGREVPYAAAYFGKYSARINAVGLGGAYPVGGLGLGFLDIAIAHRINATQEEALAKANIMFAKQMLSGSYGVHGSWTLDSQFDRMGDLACRVVWNDVIRRIALQAEPLAHNRPAHILTQRRIKQLGDAAIRPYAQAGYLRVANTGVSSLEDAAARFPGLTFPPELQGWVVYLAQLVLFPTLQGIFGHFTDADVAGLSSLLGGGEGPAAAAGEGE